MAHKLEKLLGLNIDTNQVKCQNVMECEVKLLFEDLISYISLDKLRRVKGTNTFTAYTYHYNEISLGETLESYLQ